MEFRGRHVAICSCFLQYFQTLSSAVDNFRGQHKAQDAVAGWLVVNLWSLHVLPYVVKESLQMGLS